MINKIDIKKIAIFSLVITLLLSVANLGQPSSTAHAAAPTITEFSDGFSSDAYAESITTGPDGNLWVAESWNNKIAKVTPSGVVTEYIGTVTPSAYISSITAGPDGNLWFTEYNARKIGKITTSGIVTEYTAGVSPNYNPKSITTGPDGNLWFATSSNRIGKITTSGVVTEYTTGVSSFTTDITTGPDGNLWYTVYNGKIGKITTSGVVTEYSAGITVNAGLTAITTGSDGNLWFTEDSGNKIGKITTSGVVTEYSAGITPNSFLNDITAGYDGNLWFVEASSNKIGKITTSGVVTEYSEGITSGAGPYGITTGPDGNIWFTEAWNTITRVGRVNLIPTITNPDGSTTTTVSSEYNFSTFDYTVVDNQTLILDGSVCDIVVESGGILMGTGTACTITVEPGGIISPGHSPGCLTSGNLILSGTYQAELAGTTACSGYDQLQVTGTVTVGGALNVSLLNGFVPTAGNNFTIIDNDSSDPVTGTFTNLPEGSTITIGSSVFEVSYIGGDGNDVVLTARAVPGVPNTGFQLFNINLSPLFVIVILAATLFAMIKQYNRAENK